MMKSHKFCIQHIYFVSQCKNYPLFHKTNNFNKQVLIDHFYFKHETRIKEKLLNKVYKKSQSGQIISLPCSVIIIQLQNCDVM